MRVAYSRGRRPVLLSLISIVTLVMISSSFAEAVVAQTPYAQNVTVTISNAEPAGSSITSGLTKISSVDPSKGSQYQVLQTAKGAKVSSDFSNLSVWLGNFNGSYLQPVYIPVYSNSIGSFTGLNQTFSYDPSILSFNGTLNDVSSQSVSFSYSIPVKGIVQIRGAGTFDAYFNQTVLYYLVFNSLKQNQTETSVLLDFSTFGNFPFSSSAQSIIELVEGWENLGPKDIPFSLAYGPNITYSGNGSGVVDSIGFSPLNSSVIYIGSGSSAVEGHGGVFKSVNGGESWTSADLGINPHFTRIEGIEVLPEDTSDVVVSANGFLSGGINDTGAIYKSINGGASWQETYDEGGNYLYYNSTYGLLYASTQNSIIVSSNFGSTWTTVSSFKTGQIIGACIVVPERSMEVAIFNEGGVGGVSTYISEDNGRSFSITGNFPSAGSAHFAVDPSNNSIQYYQEFAGYNYGGFYKTLNGGLSWTQVNLTAVNYSINMNLAPQYVAYDPANSSILYVGGDMGVEVSYDGGFHFEHSGLVADTRDIEIDPLNGKVYVGSDQGLFTSTDGGLVWNALNNRSSSLSFGVAVSGKNAIVTLGDYGPSQTHDGGKSWSVGLDLRNQLPPGTPGLRGEGGIAVTDPYNSSIILYAAGYMAISLDGGLTYQLPSINQIGVDNFQASEPGGFAFTANNTIYYAGNLGLFVSHDAGLSWAVLNNSPKDAYEIQLGDSGGKEVYVLNSTGIFVSENYGHNWKLLSNSSLYSFSLDPIDHSVIAGVERSAQGGGYFDAMLSFDGGKSFSYAGVAGLSPWNWVDPTTEISFVNTSYGLALVFTSGYGVYATFNLGRTWLNLNYNLPTVAVTSFEIYGETSYITTLGEGVWYDPSLFDLNFSLNAPILTGYLPSNYILSINGNETNASGYFALDIKAGKNILTITAPFGETNISLNGSLGSLYYLNFSGLVPYKYNVTFTETGLPSGSSWSITMNGTTETSNSSTITFSVLNGTYSFTVGSVSGYTISPSSETITVSGANVSQAITFAPVTATTQKYNITFMESGLPSGTVWFVNITGIGSSGPITSSSYTFSIPNGTYSYIISTVNGYKATQSSGTIAVSGLSITKSVTFTSTTVTTPSSGIPSLELYGIIGAIIVIIAALAGVLLLRRKK